MDRFRDGGGSATVTQWWIPAILAGGYAAAGQGWPSDPPSYPHYPGRTVHVLNGTWDFVFLGDVPLEPIVPRPDVWQRVPVPDAFDLRPDRPRCSHCWPGPASEAKCKQCCDRSLGHHGDPHCWGEQRLLEGGIWTYIPAAAPSLKFEICCGEDPLRGRRGVAAYRTEVQTVPGAAALLLLAGCALRCLVAVDGMWLDDHSGLSPFQVEVPVSLSGVRSVLVLADNRFNLQTHPVHQPKYDWYQAGGLLRAVQLHELPRSAPLYLATIKVFPRSARQVEVLVRLSRAAEEASGMVVRWSFGSGEAPHPDRNGCRLSDGWGELSPAEGPYNVEVPGARPWDPAREVPALHHLTVVLLEGGELLDCVRVRFGLRTVEARGHEILLNGAPLKLMGFNRHDMTDTPVLSYEDLLNDIHILGALGANFVRGAHYAQDQRFLDLCDVHGILVWEEVLGWQNTVADFSHGTFLLQMLRLATELAAASANHPSVILIGFFNEGESFDDGEATALAYSAMSAHLRRHTGNTRLISYGSNHAMEDSQLHVADVCSFHLYAGWYPTTWPVDSGALEQIPHIWEAYRRWAAERFPGKPMLATEAGAGGLFGLRGPLEQKWTEEYQSLLLQVHLQSVLANDGIAGIALWQFADVPIDRNVSSEAHRPKGLNNKGVVSLYRQPKLAFQAIAQLMHGERARRYGPQDRAG